MHKIPLPLALVYLIRFKLSHIPTTQWEKIFQFSHQLACSARNSDYAWLTEDFKPDLGLIKDAEKFCAKLPLKKQILKHLYKLPIATEDDINKFQKLKAEYFEADQPSFYPNIVHGYRQ